MKILSNKLKSALNLRSQLNFPIDGIEFIDITPLILQKDVLKEITDKFTDELKAKNIDYLLLPEARGFLFGSAIADRLGCGVIPVRKKGKLPPLYVETSFEYTKEYGKDEFELPKLVDESYGGKNFYMIDDIYATGNTIKALKNTVEARGGIVVGYGCVVNISPLNNDKEIFSLLEISEEI